MLRSMSSDLNCRSSELILADGGLGHAVDVRGLGETLGFGQIAENFQAFNLHKNN